MVGIVEVGPDGDGEVERFGGFGEVFAAVPILAKVVPGRGRIRVVVCEALEEFLVLFQPPRDIEAVQQFLDPGFVSGFRRRLCL